MIEDSLSNQRPSKDSSFIDRVMTLTFRPMDEAHARTFLSWRYQAPYDVYNVVPKQADEAVRFFVDPQNAYYSVFAPEGQFIALCCFGWDAQVPGGDYSLDALDIGMQLHPDLIGRAHDLAYVTALLDFARQTYAPSRLRTTIATFDEADIQIYQRVGFQIAQRFTSSHDGRPYVTLVRDT